MSIRRIAVFSGFKPLVVEDARARLQPSQVLVVSGPRLKAAADGSYFEALLKATEYSFVRLAPGDAIVDVLLISCLCSAKELKLEREAFFPTLRRLQVSPTLKGDIHAGNRIAASVLQVFTSDISSGLRRLTRPGPCAVALLPQTNVRNVRFERELGAMYDLAAGAFSDRLGRDIRRLRKGQGLRVGSLSYKGCENNPSHPVRRTSVRAHCDMSARLRLGFSVPDRFEFDISCDQGLEGKTFSHCDGRREVAPKGATHVNMRINGDFDVK